MKYRVVYDKFWISRRPLVSVFSPCFRTPSAAFVRDIHAESRLLGKLGGCEPRCEKPADGIYIAPAPRARAREFPSAAEARAEVYSRSTRHEGYLVKGEAMGEKWLLFLYAVGLEKRWGF